MPHRFTFLLVSLFCITASFFVGIYFGKDQLVQEIATFKHSLQVSIQSHGNILDVEKSNPDIRVIVNGSLLDGSGSVEMKR